MFRHVVGEPVYDVDVNSMYPAAMSLPLPWNYMAVINIDAGNMQQYANMIKEGRADLYFFHVVFAKMPKIHGAMKRTKAGAVYCHDLVDSWMWGC